MQTGQAPRGPVLFAFLEMAAGKDHHHHGNDAILCQVTNLSTVEINLLCPWDGTERSFQSWECLFSDVSRGS
jgi:hypothetical protein